MRERSKWRHGPHVIDTEAQSFDQACGIYASKSIAEKRRSTWKKKIENPTLRTEMFIAKARTRLLDVSVAGGVVLSPVHKQYAKKLAERPHTPHPFKDLTDEQKKAKAREMHASGLWGATLERSTRLLAKRFYVTEDVMSKWLQSD